MADRAGFKLMNVPDDNLGDLVKRASEFAVLVTVNADLFGEDASKASSLEKIATRIALSAFNTETVKKSQVAFGVNHWSEVAGTMVNCNGLLQKLSAAPTAPDAALVPAYRVLSALAGNEVTDASVAYKLAQGEAPALANVSFESIRSTGFMLDGVKA